MLVLISKSPYASQGTLENTMKHCLSQSSNIWGIHTRDVLFVCNVHAVGTE